MNNIFTKIVGATSIILSGVSIFGFLLVGHPSLDEILYWFYAILSLPFLLILIAISIMRRKSLDNIDKIILFLAASMNIVFWTLLY